MCYLCLITAGFGNPVVPDVKTYLSDSEKNLRNDNQIKEDMHFFTK